MLDRQNCIEAPPVTVFDGTPKRTSLWSDQSTPTASVANLEEISKIEMKDFKYISEESQILYNEFES
jgi:hypothetical protein